MSEDPAALPVARRKEVRRIIEDSGLQHAGIHAFLTTPKGLHLTSGAQPARRKSWDYVRHMLDLCGDLGPHGVAVLGSGRQRSAVDGVSVLEAKRRLRDGLAAVARHAADRKVMLLLEPLAPQFSNVVNTLAEAVEIVRSVDSPAVQTMFDTHNSVLEQGDHGEVIRRHFAHIRHIHVNELDGRRPGAGSYDFAPVLGSLQQLNYSGWVSLEVFDFKPSGEEVADEALRYLRRIESRL